MSTFLFTIVMAVAGLIFYLPVKTQTRALQAQTEQLQQAFLELKARQTLSQQVSRQVQKLSVQLSTVSNQQANGSHEHLAATSQINTSVAELSFTAANIAQLAEQINIMTGQVAQDSQQIAQITAQAARQSEQGLIATRETLQGSQEVALLYEQLQEGMRELDARSVKMRSILEVLGSLANETHLLSLNAAIEAAGAGENGERFRVVAQEVKRLANRSAETSRQVVEVVQEVEGVSQMLVGVVQNGHSRARRLEEVAGQTRVIIEKMRHIVDEAQLQTERISQTTREGQSLTEVIKNSTSQQRTVSEQVAGAIEGLGSVAQQSADGSSLVATTAANLEALSQELNLTLTLSQN